MKKGLVFVLCAGVVVALAGCAPEASSADNAAVATAEGCTPGGAQVEAIDIVGEFGASPTVTFDAPLDVESTQRLVVIPGSGAEVAVGDDIFIDFALYNASSGEKISDSGYDELSPSILRLDPSALLFEGVALTVACSTLGSRVVGLIPASEAISPEGVPNFGLQPDEGLILVVDVISIRPIPEEPLERLEGEPAEPGEGFPSISYDETGEPSVVIPEGDVPTEFALETLITGNGAVVAADAVVIVQYHGVNWNTGEVFDSSWERGEPAVFPTGGVIPGFRDGLVGQTVGSRVVIVIPAELGYGPRGGTSDGSIGAEDTIVFVVDILGVQ